MCIRDSRRPPRARAPRAPHACQACRAGASWSGAGLRRDGLRPCPPPGRSSRPASARCAGRAEAGPVEAPPWFLCAHGAER
eukprot:10269366-Alexandrium_andersonii.AAC.1